MITRANYEQYFLDFQEAALDATTEKELFAFLDQNPDLREEFECFVEIKLEPELNVSFPEKSRLHRSFVNENNFLSRLVAYLENDLNQSDRLFVEEYLKNNSSASQELEILRKTRILPDHLIVFSGKASLKKEAKVISLGGSFYRVTAIAAAIIILLLSFFVFVNTKQEPAFAEEKPNEKSLVSRDVTSPSQEKAFIANSAGIKEEIPATAAQPSLALSPEHKSAKNHIQKKSMPIREKVNPQLPSVILAPSESRLAQSIGIPQEKPGVQREFSPVDMNNKVETNSKVRTQVPLGDLSSVFSQEELAEFGLIAAAEQAKPMSAWDIAETGISKVAKATGVNVELDKHSDLTNNATTYALAIGRFSVSHTSIR